MFSSSSFSSPDEGLLSQIKSKMDIGNLFSSQQAAAGALQCGASMMQSYEHYHTDIAQRSLYLCKEGQKAEIQFAYLADYLNNINTACQRFHKQLKLVPHTQASVGTVQRNIVSLCDKMDRLETALGMVQARRDARRLQAWKLHSERELRKQEEQQKREYQGTESGFIAEEKRMKASAKRKALERKQEEDELKKSHMQAEFEAAVQDFKKGGTGGNLSEKALRAVVAKSRSDSRTDEEMLKDFETPGPNDVDLDGQEGGDEELIVAVPQEEVDNFYDDVGEDEEDEDTDGEVELP